MLDRQPPSLTPWTCQGMSTARVCEPETLREGFEERAAIAKQESPEENLHVVPCPAHLAPQTECNRHRCGGWTGLQLGQAGRSRALDHLHESRAVPRELQEQYREQQKATQTFSSHPRDSCDGCNSCVRRSVYCRVL